LHLRPSSHPFISGDDFRSLAQHKYENTKTFSSKKVKNGDIIFVKTDLINDWFNKIHPNINARYKLITHNSDATIGKNEIKYLDKKIIHWFAQNTLIQNEKITPIPIGIENIRLFQSGWILKKKLLKSQIYSKPKLPRILYGFSIDSNINERTIALKSLRKRRDSDEIYRKLDANTYFDMLRNYAFIASPEGNGPDCHRTWEALYLGVTPIVKNNISIDFFGKIGIPLLIINDWNNIDTNIELNREKNNLIYFEYWKNVIINAK
jgi:hypothetical protein